MNHYMDFDPYLIRERNEQMIREATRCASRSGCGRLADRAVHGSLPSPGGGVMPLLRAARLAG